MELVTHLHDVIVPVSCTVILASATLSTGNICSQRAELTKRVTSRCFPLLDQYSNPRIKDEESLTRQSK